MPGQVGLGESGGVLATASLNAIIRAHNTKVIGSDPTCTNRTLAYNY